MSRPMADHAARPLGEHQRRGGRLDPLLVRVLAVVAADRHDLARARHRGKQLGLGKQRDLRRRRGGGIRRRRRGREVGEPVGSESDQVSHGAWAVREHVGGGPPRVPGDDSERLAGGGSGGDQAHNGSSCSAFWPVDGGLDDTIRSSPASTTRRVPWPSIPSRASRSGGPGCRSRRLGFGGASIGGMFSAVTDDDARTTIRHAWDLGIRYFDTAPLYGYGASERRVGAALRGRAPRRLRPVDEGRPARPDAGRDRPRRRARPPALRRPRRRLLRHPRARAHRLRLLRPTASGGRSRRAWSGSGSSGSTSR